MRPADVAVTEKNQYSHNCNNIWNVVFVVLTRITGKHYLNQN